MSFPLPRGFNKDEVEHREVGWRSRLSRSGRPPARSCWRPSGSWRRTNGASPAAGVALVPVEKHYAFATDDGPKSLPELFDGRSQLLIYHLMFGEDWKMACPGCTSVGDGLGGMVTHVNDRDVTLIAMSRAPLEKLVATKAQRGWTMPYVSGYGDDFLFDYGFALRREEMSGIVRDEFDMGQLLRCC
ncbi:DUF899 family protein [Mesorhizobium sp. M0816]|uniref:DUF899 family protein n=1 Tax=Mesorhizobium sp. M0816 TaxID=2957006 RepID=UPI00333C9843